MDRASSSPSRLGAPLRKLSPGSLTAILAPWLIAIAPAALFVLDRNPDSNRLLAAYCTGLAIAIVIILHHLAVMRHRPPGSANPDDLAPPIVGSSAAAATTAVLSPTFLVLRVDYSLVACLVIAPAFLMAILMNWVLSQLPSLRAVRLALAIMLGVAAAIILGGPALFRSRHELLWIQCSSLFLGLLLTTGTIAWWLRDDTHPRRE